MIAVIQRVLEAKVIIGNKIRGKIDKGLLILIGIAENDEENDCEWLANKIIGMRIFGDNEGKMNLNLEQIDGNILLISQFTLHASTKKGNRPSFINAAKPEKAIPLYETLISKLSFLLKKEIQTGVFGADMQVSLINDGPVTILLDSKNKV